MEVSRFRIKSHSANQHYVEEQCKFLWWTYWTRVREHCGGYAGSSYEPVCTTTVAEAKQWIEKFLYDERLKLNEKLERELHYPKVVEYP